MIGSCVTNGTPSIALGRVKPVEVQRERLVHLVLHEEPHAIARVHRDQRSRHLPVERHRVDERCRA